ALRRPRVAVAALVAPRTRPALGAQPAVGAPRRAPGPAGLRQHGPPRRPATGRLVAVEIPGQALKRMVRPPGPDDRANERQLVGHPSQTREQLADLDPGDVGGDRVDLAADLGGSIGLDVPHVLVRGAA